MAMNPRESILALRERMLQSIVGQERMVGRILLGLLAKGHLLVEGGQGARGARPQVVIFEAEAEGMRAGRLMDRVVERWPSPEIAPPRCA